MTYSSEEMQQILQKAFVRKQEGEFTQEQIIEIALELGVSSESLQAAEKEWLIQQVEMKKQHISNSQKRREFKSHLMSFIVINGFLILLNLFTSPSYFWAIYPILGWGLGLLLHGIKTYMIES
jgi:2TM domain